MRKRFCLPGLAWQSPISCHNFKIRTVNRSKPNRVGDNAWPALGNSMENAVITNLMFGGVLDAFPKLRLERGGTQVPHFMEGLAAMYSG